MINPGEAFGTLRTAGFELVARRSTEARVEREVECDLRHHATTPKGQDELAQFVGLDTTDGEALVQQVLAAIERGHVAVRARPVLPMLCGPAETEAVELSALTVIEEFVQEYTVELQLLDQDDTPVAGAEYRLTLPDGSVRTGTLDDRGLARVQGLRSPDPCTVSFPEFDGPSWSYVHATPL